MTLALAFKTADPSHHAEALRVLRAAFTLYMRGLGREVSPTAFSTLAQELAEGCVYLALDAGRIVGVATIKRAPGEMEITHVAVDPPHQGAGIGGWLLRRLEAQARVEGVQAMTLYTAAVMDHLLRLYRRHGFVEVRRGPPPHGKDDLPRVFMRKLL